MLAWQASGRQVDPARIPRYDGKATVLLNIEPRSTLHPAKYERFLVSGSFTQTGLKEEFRTEGFGVPVVAARSNMQKTPQDLDYPPEGMFHPGCAWVNFSRDGRVASLEVESACRTGTATVVGKKRTLAKDITLPWALLLSETKDLRDAGWTGLVRPGEAMRPARLYLMEPYQPDKIPLVMVHGLQSSPLAWMQLTNRLRGQEMVLRNYQIWHFYYPTGTPVAHNARLFREELKRVQALFDPKGRDLADNSIAGALADGVKLPQQFSQLHKDWIVSMKLELELELTPEGRRVLKKQTPSSIRSLSPRNPLLIALDIYNCSSFQV